MGLTEQEFFDCTPRYFAAMQKAYVRRERMEWERSRFTAFLSLYGKLKDGVRITQLHRFEWEKEAPKKIEPADVEQLKKFEEEAREIFKKQFGVKFENGKD